MPTVDQIKEEFLGALPPISGLTGDLSLQTEKVGAVFELDSLLLLILNELWRAHFIRLDVLFQKPNPTVFFIISGDSISLDFQVLRA